MIANTVLAATLALLQWIAPHLLAGVLGIFAFALLLLVNVYQPQKPAAYVFAWSCISLYSLVALFALLSG